VLHPVSHEHDGKLGWARFPIKKGQRENRKNSKDERARSI